jgi:hypothetical protein
MLAVEVSACRGLLQANRGLTELTCVMKILNNLQITTAPAKSFPACYVFTSRSLGMASNNGDSSEAAVCLFACCIAMAVLIVCFKVFA